MKFSIFNPLEEYKGSELAPVLEMSLSDIISDIRHYSEYVTDTVKELRKLVALKQSKAKQKQLKKKLHSFTPSGLFDGGGKAEHLRQYSHVVAVDLDDLPRREVPAIKKKAMLIRYTLAAFISPSGNGLKILVKVDTPKDLHGKAFEVVNKYYSDKLGVAYDKTGKNLNRLCFFSHDSDAYLNINSDAFPANFEIHSQVKSSQPVEKPQVPKASASSATGVRQRPVTAETFSKAITITERSAQFVEGQRYNYLLILTGNLNRYAVPQIDAEQFIFDSFGHSIEQTENVKRMIADIYEKYGYEHGKYIRHAQAQPAPQHNNKTQNKPTGKKQKPSQRVVLDFGREDAQRYTISKLLSEEAQVRAEKQMRLEKTLNKLYDFRFNTLIGAVEYRTKGKGRFKKCLAKERNSIRRQLKFLGYNTSKEDLKDTLESDFCKAINPIKEYFGKLKWDGKNRIPSLAACVPTEVPELFADSLRKWLVASVANVFIENTCTNHVCLILNGGQGLFKTTFWKSLVPDELFGLYHFIGAINPRNKDSLNQLATCFMIIVDEQLDDMEEDSRTSNALKNMITQPTVKLRRPWGELDESLPRIANFCGTLNNREFLSDQTGNRRYMPFWVTDRIDIDALDNMDIGQIWAEAFELYKQGFDYVHKETKDIKKYKETFDSPTAEKGLVLRYFKRAEANEPGALFDGTEDLFITLQEMHPKVKLSMRKLGSTFNQLGFERDRVTLEDGTRKKGLWYKLTEKGHRSPLS